MEFFCLFPYRCSDAMAMATVISYLFVQGCRRCYIDRFAWLLSQSLLALRFAADDCGARIILPLA